jgi:hypothetical protein
LRTAAVRALVGIGSLLASLLVLGGAYAYACNEPAVHVHAPPDVQAGDTIVFDVTDTTRGAEFYIRVNGTMVVSGTDDTEAQGYRGTFEIPDLGSQDVDVIYDTTVAHPADQTAPNSTPQRRSRYRAPLPPPSQPAPVSDPAPSPAPSPAPQGSGGASVGPPPALPGALGAGPPEAPSGGRPAGDARPSTPAAATRPAVARDPVLTRAAAAAAELAALTPVATDRSATDARRLPARAGAAGLAAGPPAPALVRAVGTAAVQPGEGPPVILIVACAMLLLAGIGGGGYAYARARCAGPPPELGGAEATTDEFDSVALEAELQEILAEEESRQVTEVERETAGTPA